MTQKESAPRKTVRGSPPQANQKRTGTRGPGLTFKRPYSQRINVEVMQSVVHRATHVPAVQIGVGCTTLTAALSYLLGAPRILQAGHAPSWMHS